MFARTGQVAVFVSAFTIFSFNLWQTSIGAGWIDPILHYGAQDESVYSRQAIQMATQGGWMTPTLQGRWMFEKPPLLLWLSAWAMKLFGIGPFTARLPSLLAGAGLVTLCYSLVRNTRSTCAAIVAALLCVSNQLLFTMARHNMTDILLTAAMVLALYALVADPSLNDRRSYVTFTLAIVAGILSKAIAGLLPVFASLLFAVLSGPPRVPRLRRTVLLSCVGVALASPWFLYNLIEHRQWFLADLGVQIIRTGVAPQQTSLENPVAFYLTRFLYAAPLTAALLITGIPALFRGLRRRDAVPLLLACYLTVISAALLLFRFHTEQYLTPLLPVAILVAAIFSPLLKETLQVPVALTVAMVFILKAANPDQPWGVSYQAGFTLPVAAPLSAYCGERRGNDLFVLGGYDQFYPMVLPLPRVRYGWLDPSGSIADFRPHLVYLGIVQDATAADKTSLYASRLRAWGQQSTESIGTSLTARTMDGLAGLVLAHPESDFLVSPEIENRLGGRETQQVRLRGKNYVLLESRVSRRAGAPAWTCGM